MQFMMSEREPRRQEPGAREHCTLRTRSPLQPHLRRVVTVAWPWGGAPRGRTPRLRAQRPTFFSRAREPFRAPMGAFISQAGGALREPLRAAWPRILPPPRRPPKSRTSTLTSTSSSSSLTRSLGNHPTTMSNEVAVSCVRENVLDGARSRGIAQDCARYYSPCTVWSYRAMAHES